MCNIKSIISAEKKAAARWALEKHTSQGRSLDARARDQATSATKRAKYLSTSCQQNCCVRNPNARFSGSSLGRTRLGGIRFIAFQTYVYDSHHTWLIYFRSPCQLCSSFICRFSYWFSFRSLRQQCPPLKPENIRTRVASSSTLAGSAMKRIWARCEIFQTRGCRVLENTTAPVDAGEISTSQKGNTSSTGTR